VSNKTTRIISIIVSLALIALAIFLVYRYVFNNQTSISYTQFRTYVNNYISTQSDESKNASFEVAVDEEEETATVSIESYADGTSTDEMINTVYVSGYQLVGYYKSGNTTGPSYKTVAFSMYSNGDIIEEWAKGGVNVSFSDPNSSSVWSNVMYFVVMIGIAVVFIIMMRQSMSGATKGTSFAKSKARVSSNIKVRFSDVAGADEEKNELAEIVGFLKAPKKYLDVGARTPKGVLLVGPPGTGKTLLAKAIAGEAGVPFFSASGSDFVEMFVGVGASRVRDLFDTAKKNAPCIIFIDEIDAVGRQRGAGLGGGHDEREQTLNQILVQMDGFENNDGVIVIAATNRADVLDPALLRPGRFDRQVYVNLPDVKGREAILKVHARNKPIAAEVNFKTLARMTVGFSGADLANLLNEAAILAARADKKIIGNAELYEGINKVLMGPQKKSRVVTESDKRCTAYHESGHAILAYLCPHCDPVHEVSIIPRGNAAGYTMTRPDSDDNDVSYNMLNDRICMILGGRVAEELVIKDITTGASNDIQKATDLARRMVTEWGMSEKLGMVAYGDDSPVFIGRSYESKKVYSEQTAAEIDDEIKRIVSEAHTRATKLLSENRAKLDVMARVLVEKETIYTEEVDLIMQDATYDEVIAKTGDIEEKVKENPFARFEG